MISIKSLNGESIGGKTFSYGVKENCVGIPKENPNLNPEVYKAAVEIQEKISDGKIISPGNEKDYNEFSKKLSNGEIL